MAGSKPRHSVLAGILQYQPVPRRVRGTVGRLAIVDSRHPVLVWESDRAVPHYAFPYDEVNLEMLRTCRGIVPPHRPGAAEWFDLKVGEHTVSRVAWAYSIPELSSYIAFDRAHRALSQVARWQERPLNGRDRPA